MENEFSLTRDNRPLTITSQQIEDIRQAMKHTLLQAKKMDLAKMAPQNSLTSTAYCLANAGSEYLVYAPSAGSFTVDLSDSTSTFAVDWINPGTGAITQGPSVQGGSASQRFTAPFNNYGTVLHLRLAAEKNRPPK